MAFIPGSISEKYLNKDASSSGEFVPGSVSEKYIKREPSVLNTLPPLDKGFVPGSVASKYKKVSDDTDSSEGLYNLAVQSGLQGRADDILKQQQGEETKKFLSGGFISDVFDVLNAAQYGVTGLL